MQFGLQGICKQQGLYFYYNRESIKNQEKEKGLWLLLFAVMIF